MLMLRGCKYLVRFSRIGFFLSQIRVRVRFRDATFSTERINTDKHSFTESYLKSNFDLSPKEALSISRKIQFRSAEQPDSIIAILRSHGFTDTHILKFVKSYPHVFNCNPSRFLLPKLNFFSSLGISNAQLPSFMSSGPNVLKMSIQNRFLPIHKFLKHVIGLDDFKIAGAIKRAAWASNKDSVKNLASNISLLRELDVPKSPLVSLITTHTVLLRNPVYFKEKVDEVKQIGFNPRKPSFCVALRVLSQLSKPNWDAKVRNFTKYGWSENDARLAFKKSPICMTLSEENVSRKMEFFVDKIGLKPAYIAWNPMILLFSMEKRLIPRCSVFKILVSKGILKDGIPISRVLCPSDKVFIDKFIVKYEEEAPELANVYNGVMDISEMSRLDSSPIEEA